ncbi:MAG: hypothetical protein ACRDSK_27025 [Actinophytocola sp.]|uniref:hypothetical protein n=1 Tax=Actinophytocola sp. TaxID=1872138 RepID=UPI003D6AF314
MTRPGGDSRQAVVLVLTAVCGMVGGLLAVGLLADRFDAASVWAPLLIVAGAGVAATAVAFLLLTTTTAPPRQPQVPPRQHPAPQQPAAQRPWYEASAGANQNPSAAHRPPARTPQAAMDPQPRADPGHLVLPLNDGGATAEGGGRDWWNRSAPAAGGTADNDTRPAPNLSSYVAEGSALVAQCPNCGDFRIDVRRADPAYAFRCRNPRCGEEWRWTPGTAWPSVVVRRNLTGRERG